MSSKRGNVSRTRPQKYQNRFSFKNDLHDSSHTIKMINNIKIAEVCERCKKIIDWKRQYRKYKPLTAPKTCNLCHQKTVKQAYHVICTPCAVKARKCAKCLISADEVQIIPPNKTEKEQVAEQAELDKMLKNLPERRRRTFLRYLKQKNKKKDDENEDESTAKDEEKVETKDLDDVIRKKFDELKLMHKDMQEELGFLHDLEDSDEDDDEEVSDLDDSE